LLKPENPFHIAPDESSPDAAAMRHFVFRGSFEVGTGGLAGHQMRRLKSESGLCDFFDTPVWSLWFNNAILAHESGWTLQVDGEALGCGEFSDTPKFAEDFPEGPLRARLEDFTHIRALRKTASVRLERELWEAHDASGKALFRIALCRISGSRSNKIRTTLIEILPVRGGKIRNEAIGEALLDIGCRPTHENLVQEAYKICRVRPTPYSLKLRLAFAPETHARTVLLEIFSNLLSIARWNEEGIIKDIDTEFLHDFRVSLRKLRSVTGQMKGVFPEQLTEAWKRQIGDLCRRTNTLRDYDVYLLSRRRLENMLPEELRDGLDSFFEELKAERHGEAARVAEFFRSDAYKNQITSLQDAWASAHTIEASPNSARPIFEVAGEQILKRFRRIRKTTKAITPDTPDAVIHSIRIDCKKMRYLLECFGHLFPAETVDPLARQLAKLQNRLGRYNDTSVQQDYLLQHAGRHLESSDTRLALSLGGLIGSLHHEHAALREKLCATLNRFSRGSNARRAASLLQKA
jgi:CHAD domain-containing protein